MILPSALAHLHINRSFIGLYVSSADHLSPHRGDHRDQQLAHFEDPAVKRYYECDENGPFASSSHKTGVGVEPIANFIIEGGGQAKSAV
jgi:hypothetical protein